MAGTAVTFPDPEARRQLLKKAADLRVVLFIRKAQKFVPSLYNEMCRRYLDAYFMLHKARGQRANAILAEMKVKGLHEDVFNDFFIRRLRKWCLQKPFCAHLPLGVLITYFLRTI